MDFYMSKAARALVNERLMRGEWTSSGRYCRVVDQPNTVCAACKQRSADYRQSKKGGDSSNTKACSSKATSAKAKGTAATGGVLAGRVEKNSKKKKNYEPPVLGFYR
ncbi:hypothetical protein B0H65DRAFT_446858 [Neurospora tetraspora]|uniref:Uncharacterized protein n=1 Tax=Neurospora tetraspora TaxID=94610 RepID=A0AAE0J0G9_9PEZI|nr:hypothetical protein B0H65DRAFT_446858 [Neurospora tetraspora]